MEAIVLDGATLTPDAVVRIARSGVPVELAAVARERNAAARRAVEAVLARGDELYGASTGVGPLREHHVEESDRSEHQLALLRSHACGAGRALPEELVRAAMATRANQLGAGGAGVSDELLDALVDALNAGAIPTTRELGSLGTGDLTALADIALALVGDGTVRLGPRDGLAFMSSNAVTIAHAALLVADAAALLDHWLTVAALSFEAAGADPVVLDPRVHAGRHLPGQVTVAARMSDLLAGVDGRTREPSTTLVQDPYPFRALPQVDGVVQEALTALTEVVTHELNFAGENALIVAVDEVALANGNPHAAVLANAIDGLRTALAQSAALIAARVSALLDTSLTGLPAFLALNPGPESGALILEYTAHASAAEVRSLVTPVAAQTVSVARGVESHASLAPIAARRAHEALDALRVLVAVELVAAVRALRLAGHDPAGAGSRELYERAAAALPDDMRDRPLAPDIEIARGLLQII
jgi:histidine ammonia-lyase